MTTGTDTGPAALREAAQRVVDVWNPMLSMNVPRALNGPIAVLEAELDRAALPAPVTEAAPIRDAAREAIEAVIVAWEREPVWTRGDVIAGLRAALAARPGPSGDADAEWEALIVTTEPDAYPQAQKRLRGGVARHRPLIEAAIRAEAWRGKHLDEWTAANIGPAPSEGAGGLDVERLASDLSIVLREVAPGRMWPVVGLHEVSNKDFAAMIVQALAALSEPTP